MTKSSVIAGLCFLIATSLLLPSSALAQWGTNGPRCPQGRCAPPRQSWGYHETKWSRWPGAVYPDMIRPQTGRPGAEIPPSQIDLPKPAEEAEVRPSVPTPARITEPRPSTVTPRATESPIPGGPSQPGNENTSPNRLPGLGPLDDLPGDVLPDSSHFWRKGGAITAASEDHDLPPMRAVPGELDAAPSPNPMNEIRNGEPMLLEPSSGSKPLDAPTQLQTPDNAASSSWRNNNPLRASPLRSVSVQVESARASMVTNSLHEGQPLNSGRANPLR